MCNETIKNTIIKVEKDLLQSDLFTRQHVKYIIKLYNCINGKTLITTYQCNPKYHDPKNVKDILSCLVSDAQCWEYSNDISDFQKDLGYTDIKQCINAYNACQETYHKLLDYCGSEKEYNDLKKYFEEY